MTKATSITFPAPQAARSLIRRSTASARLARRRNRFATCLPSGQTRIYHKLHVRLRAQAGAKIYGLRQ